MTSLTVQLWAHSRACPAVPLLLTLQQAPQAGKEAPTVPSLAMGKHVTLLWLSGSFFRGSSFLLLCWGCWHPASSHCLGHPLLTQCTHATLKVGPCIGSLYMALSAYPCPALNHITLVQFCKHSPHWGARQKSCSRRAEGEEQAKISQCCSSFYKT